MEMATQIKRERIKYKKNYYSNTDLCMGIYVENKRENFDKIK